MSVAGLPAVAAAVTEAIELKPHMEAPPVGQPPVAPNTEQSAPVNPAVEIGLVIKLRERRVYVYRGDRVETSYPIAIGKAGWETPTGTFKILHMERDPYWEHPLNGQVIPPGPNNPLGRRWIAFWTDGKNFIGFHGTPNERLIGQAVSHGCIRMRNRDVEALYEQVTVGTPVIVQR
ncbi:L,D-transpeptidase [Microseira sp. BLCC-F43]|uniref:L,D-transpeptidase n=1 Tax=Microseira sp. BLCC-F43 TaxID=3153602 RepID=UPI0035B95B9F